MLKNKKKHQDKTAKLLEFEATEFAKYTKNLGWYLGALAFFGIVLAAAIGINDLRLAAIILLAAVVFYQMAMVEPKRTDVALTKTGLTFKGNYYPWHSFESFTLVSTNGHVSMYLHKLSNFSGPVVVPLPSKRVTTGNHPHPEALVFVKFLRGILPEKFHAKPTFGEWLGHMVKF